MRFLTWSVRFVVFLLLVAFAAKNVEPVTLRFYFDLALQAPLVVLLLAFFAAGTFFGILALLGTVLRQRREIGRLRREHSAPAKAPSPDITPPLPPA